MRYMIMARIVLIGQDRRTAAARHLPPDTSWSDSISGDGERVLSIVEGELSSDVVDALERDIDVLDFLELPDGPVDTERMEKVRQGAGRFGIPVDAMPETPTADDVISAAKRRMLLSQITLDQDLAKIDMIETGVERRLLQAGFDPSVVESGMPADRLRKIQKKKDA